LSPVFACLINGKMSESITKSVLLDDVDVDTFIQFCEYAYTGDYHVPPPKVVKMESEPKTLVAEEQHEKSELKIQSRVIPHKLALLGETETRDITRDY